MLKNKSSLIVISGVALLVLVPGLFAASDCAYNSGKRRDPFVPLAAEAVASASATSSGVKLEGIIYDPGAQSMAILNGKTYQAGDVAGDVTVVKILKDQVVISVDGEEKILSMRSEEKS
jgi:type II secretory pathway component PulC